MRSKTISKKWKLTKTGIKTGTFFQFFDAGRAAINRCSFYIDLLRFIFE